MGHGRQDKQNETEKNIYIATCPCSVSHVPPHVSVAFGEINICVRVGRLDSLPSTTEPTQATRSCIFRRLLTWNLQESKASNALCHVPVLQSL